mmetsp:Transcript_20583/g.50628  ORF Transcript_20583/g.50628 Transcript_20583/m.50628 type:complete len:213 (+) Transcript_20583:946-1584(+)
MGGRHADGVDRGDHRSGRAGGDHTCPCALLLGVGSATGLRVGVPAARPRASRRVAGDDPCSLLAHADLCKRLPPQSGCSSNHWIRTHYQGSSRPLPAVGNLLRAALPPVWHQLGGSSAGRARAGGQRAAGRTAAGGLHQLRARCAECGSAPAAGRRVAQGWRLASAMRWAFMLRLDALSFVSAGRVASCVRKNCFRFVRSPWILQPRLRFPS